MADEKVADLTSHSKSHPPIDRVESGWLWEGLRISAEHHWVEFTLVFPQNIFAPIHGEFWVFSEGERRCVRGGTLIPDLCHYSNDFMMSGSLDLIVMNEHGPFHPDDGCRALIAHFEYDPDDIVCKSFAYDHGARRRMLAESSIGSEDVKEQRVALNFTLILEDGTLYRDLVERIVDDDDLNHQGLSEGLKLRLMENTNATVISVAVIDLQYHSEDGLVDDEGTEQEIDTDSRMRMLRVGAVLTVLFSVMVLISCFISRWIERRSHRGIGHSIQNMTK